MHIIKLKRSAQAQDFQGYYGGEVPEYAVDLLGTGSVDASQIKTMFSRVDDVIRLVNQFDSSLLGGISFIFNFSKGGAYGVYLPALDRAIKAKALTKKMESMGYRIEVDEKGLLTAYPTREQKTPEQIQQDIDSIKYGLESKGGSAFGINMSDVLNSARLDAEKAQSPDPNIWEWMAILHLGGTIVHEAIHAQGHEDEGPSESTEASFLNMALPIVNQEYQNYLEGQGQGDQYSPLVMTGDVRHASGKGWYKTAQLSYYVPQAFLADPVGSDLSGRFPFGIQSDKGMAEWGLEAQDSQHVSIEERLGRQYMSPLPPGLSQEHDSYEEQLRKYTVDDKKLDPTASLELLLSEGHDEPRGYETMEGLLDEKRVKPLLSPLKKEASIKKKATLFGWMNNLEISDGSTIPGLGDRVMSWDDRDESFSEEEKDIRKQPRYNPAYDVKGFYYRFVEIRDRPQLWDQMLDNLSGVAPAKRFASKIAMDKDLLRVLSVLSLIGRKVQKGEIKGTRILVSEDILPIAVKILKNCSITVFPLKKNGGDVIYAVWVCPDDIDKKKIKKAEMAFESAIPTEGDGMVEELTGYSESRNKVFQEIIGVVRDLCTEYGVRDVYLVGGYPRDLVLRSNPVDLDFSGAWPNQCIKIGGLVAERLGVDNVEFLHRTMTLSFEYKGVKIDFRGNFVPAEIREKLREHNIKTTPLNMDIYNRDFTINMFVYDFIDGGIHDICKCSKKDVNDGVIRTFLDSEFVCSENPLVIMRALMFSLRYGFKIDMALQKAMITNSPKLFDGRYSDERLRIARENVEREDRGRSQKLFEEYGVEKIMEV